MVSTTSPSESPPILTISRAQIAAQVQALGLPVNTLSAVFDLPMEAVASSSPKKLNQYDQAMLQIALPLLAAPALVARTRATLDEGSLLATWIVTGSSNDPSLTPYLLLAHDEEADNFRIRPVLDRDTVARSLMPYLDTGLPAMEGSAFEMSAKSFVVLTALCDLVRRARFSAYLDHTSTTGNFTKEDIHLALNDGNKAADPRWLLPQLLAIRPDLSKVDNLDRWLDELTKRGWITKNKDSVSLTESGMSQAASLDQRVAMLTFWVVGATPEGELASRSTMLIRSPWHIWCFDVGGDDGKTVIGAPVDLSNAYGLLQDLITPVGVPPIIQQALPEPEPVVAISEPAVKPSTAPQPIPWQLVIREGSQTGQVISLVGAITIGRAESCDLHLEDGKASRKHARIERRQNAFWITDLGSSNGVIVNDSRITEGTQISPGDCILIGDTLLEVVAESISPTESATIVDMEQPVHQAPAPSQKKSQPAAAQAPSANTCQQCGQPLSPTARFCATCGTPTTKKCKKCGNTLSATARFCAECGTTVTD